MDMIEEIIDAQTPDGPMAIPSFRPADGGPRPGVIVVMEAFGVNPNITALRGGSRRRATLLPRPTSSTAREGCGSPLTTNCRRCAKTCAPAASATPP